MKNFRSQIQRMVLPMLVLLLVSITSFAQNTTVKGHVVDGKGEAIIGANVFVKGTTIGTSTDVDGKFVLSVPDRNSVLVVRFIGYKNAEVLANVANAGNVVLEEDSQLIDDVVVIGYGKVKKSDATGSVLAVKNDPLNKGSQVSVQDALVGKIAGVNVTPSSGAPGSGATIRIRMGSSLSASNDPLIVIDGVPIDNGSVNGSSNIIGSINPNDIETFTVLKDASSTAIYGSRASNGVIIITTKKGKSGSKIPSVNYSSNFSVSTVPDYLDVLSTDEFRTVFAEHSGAPESFKLGDASTDWQKEIYRTAFGQEHNLSLSGSAASMPYIVSLGYTNQDGIIKTNNYERMNAGVGISPKFFDKHLSADINVKGSIENNQLISTSTIGDALSFDPTRPIRETYANNVGLGYYTWIVGGAPLTIAPSNPVAELNLTDNKNKVTRSIGNMVLDYKIHGLEDLRFNMNMGYDVLKSTRDKFIPQFAPSMYISNQKDGRGLDESAVQNKENYLFDFYADYSKTIGKHSISAMAGYGWQHFWTKFNQTAFDTEGNELTSASHSESEYFLLSYYGRLNYGFNDKYLLTATLRADASSRFAKDNRRGYFPSAAFAWKVANEDFLKDVRAVSEMKIRMSFGKTGQQDIGSDYMYIPIYMASQDESRYQMGDYWYTTYRPNGYDPNIKWETTSTYNFGLDWGFLNNRIYGSVDFYTRKTNDLLNNIYIPAGSNFTNQIYTNIGSMKNKGMEIAANFVPVRTNDWEWSVSGNFTWNSSEITKLNTIDTDDNYVKTGNAGGTGKYLQIHKVGATPYTFFLLKQAYDEDGKPLDGQYVAKDGSITTSEEDANKYDTGKSSQAPYFCGVSTKVTYKSWDLGMNGHGNFGNYVYNYVAAGDSYDALYSSQGTSGNILKSSLKSGFTQDRLYTDYFLEKASFFRIDNITLGYSFRNLWNDKSSLRLSFAVQNVCTFTNYSGLDPEIYSGIDRNIYQRPRMFMFGMNLNF